MDSENLSSLIRLSVTDGQKTDSSKVVSVIDMDAATVFRNLVTNKFMPHHDYTKTKFSFNTLFYKSHLFYCCCPCAFEHEYLEYINEDLSIDEILYEKVKQNIIDGKCPHVDDKPPSYVRETSIYSIHIALVIGTEIYMTDKMNKLTGIFQLEPYELYMMKNRYLSLDVSSPVLPKAIYVCRGQLMLTRKILNGQRRKVRLDAVTILEYFIQEKNSIMFKAALNTKFYHSQIDRIFKVIFDHNLGDQFQDMSDDLSEYHMYLLGKGNCFLPTYYAELAIVYNQANFLQEILQCFWPGNPMSEDVKHSLVKTCSCLNRTQCADILSQYRFPRPKPLSESSQLSELFRLLGSYYDHFKSEIIDNITKIPNLRKLINNGDRVTRPGCITGPCRQPSLHHYIKENMDQLDFRVVKAIFDLGADVDKSISSTCYTPLTLLLSFMSKNKDLLGFHKTLEVILNENPNPRFNKDAVKIAFQLDLSLHTTIRNVIKSDFTGEYIMDATERSIFGLDDVDSIPLNFAAPLLIECGFLCTRETLHRALELSLHPAEHLYLQEYLVRLQTPKPLKLCCRDFLRRHYKGRRIHTFVERNNIPDSIKRFILLENLLNICSFYTNVTNR